jgi:small subunit ribosomal protein S4
VTKIVRAKKKICRRLGENLWGKANNPVLTKNYRPGQHGRTAIVKDSDYGKQLKAKQKLKGYYGRINEKQFRKIYDEARRLKGDTGENLVGLLERRLDAIVFRLNFANSIFAARQLVSHGHIRVKRKNRQEFERVNIPSYRVSEGDEIEVAPKSKEMTPVLEAAQKKESDVPEYLEVDSKALRGKFIRIPKLEDIPYAVIMEPHLIVEFYSR